MHVAARQIATLGAAVTVLVGVSSAEAGPGSEPSSTEASGATTKSPLVIAAPPTAESTAKSNGSGDVPVMAIEPVPEPSEAEDDFGVPCVVIGRPGCGTQALLEIGMGWGESSSYVGTQWSYRGYLDAGLLVGLGDDFQLGPTAELGFDVGRVNSGYTLSPKLRARYWIGGWYIALDGAAGAAFEHFTFDEGTENGTREGVVAELGLSVLGVLGPYAAIYALGDPGGRASHEERWIVGFRGSIASWFAAIGLAFSEGSWIPLL
jgi:hypothetical protein